MEPHRRSPLKIIIYFFSYEDGIINCGNRKHKYTFRSRSQPEKKIEMQGKKMEK
ncbi:unnamed protein product, partial [Prunus brigantina]